MNRVERLVWVSVALLLLAGRAVGQEVVSLTDVEVSNRLAYIESALDAGRPAANLWWYGWMAGYGAATAGQLAVRSSTDNEKQRQDMLVGAYTTAFGAAGQLIFPLEAGRFSARLKGLPGATPEARRAKLAAAEELLRTGAAQERLGRSWQPHALAAAVNLGAGLVIWRRYDRPARDGLLTFAIGQIISEVQIFTQPMRAVRDLREYERRSDFDRTSALRPERTWYVSAIPGGLVVGCSF
jgi:hypothetical protein